MIAALIICALLLAGSVILVWELLRLLACSCVIVWRLVLCVARGIRRAITR